MRKKKVKIPPISEARYAIFEKYFGPRSDWPEETPERVRKLHEQVYTTRTEDFVRACRVTWVDHETTGNELIEKCLAGEVERARIMKARVTARDKHLQKFEQVFSRPLSRYLHMFWGFDVIKFDEEIVRPPDGVSTHDEIQRRFGDEALAMVKELIS